MESDAAQLNLLGMARRAAALVRRSMHGRPQERLLRTLMKRAPALGKRSLLHLLPQPGDFDVTEHRRVQIDGVAFDLYPKEYIQWLHYFGCTDPNLETLRFLARSARCVFDVGANVGLYSLLTAASAPQCEVVAFEAHPKTFERLRAHVSSNPQLKVQPVQVAVAAADGQLSLFLSEQGDSGMASIAVGAGAARGAEVVVRARTLDALADELGRAPQVIKIDVEGYEPEVLIGARKTLTDARPELVLEWTPSWSVERPAALRRAVELLSDLGYRAWTIPHLPDLTFREVALDELSNINESKQLNLVLSTRDRAAELRRHYRVVGPHG